MKYPLTRKKKIPGCYRPPQVQIRARYFGIQKLTWMKRFLALDDDDPIITTLIHLGNSSISKSLTDAGELPADVQPLERFVCMLYCTT